MANEKYTFTETWKSECILAIMFFIPLLFTIIGRF